MNQIKYIIIVCLLALSTTMTWGQTTAVIAGQVTEDVNGNKVPIYGANVVVADTKGRYITGASTNALGNYNFRVPLDQGDLKVVVSFIGFTTKSIPYTKQSKLDVTLSMDAQMFESINVVARKSEVDQMTGLTDRQQTAATQRVEMDELMANSPVVSVEDALQGQLGGVDIIASGDPGARSSIRIRGVSTLEGSADPLIVIDGIPYITDVSDDFSWATASADDFGQLVNISPNDIESIEVLKDAASTAIWGTQGANGVLMIKTKRGTSGKTRFSFSSKFTTRVEPEAIPMLNGTQYTSLMQESIWNSAIAQGLGNSADLLNLLYNSNEINYSPDWRYFDEYNQNTVWLDEVRKNSFTIDNSFSMQGGGDKAKYRFSLAYVSDDGTTIGNSMQRLNSSLNINYYFSDKLRVDFDFTYTNTNTDRNAVNDVRSEAMYKMPNKSPYWMDDDTGERTDEYFSYQTSNEFQGAFGYSSSSRNGSNFNPVAMVHEGYFNSEGHENKTTFRLNYKFIPELTYEGWVNLKLSSTKTQQFIPQSATGVTGFSDMFNRSSDGMTDGFTLQTSNQLLFNKKFNNKHNLVATLIYRTTMSRGSSYASVTSGAASGELSDPTGSGQPADWGAGQSEYKSLTLTGNVHYTLNNKYMFNFTGSYEGNSNLGRNNRFGFFPALGFAWQLQDESFMTDLYWLKQSKIRLTYGKSGRSPSGTAAYVGSFGATGSYMDMPAIGPTSIQLNNLKWETNTEYNIGADFSLFDKHPLNFTIDYYHRTTTDLLQRNVSLPSSVGIGKVGYMNSGKVLNQGLEFRFDYQIFKNADWDITINANVARNVNEILELPSNLTQETYSFDNGEYAQRLEENVPIGSFFGYKYTGVYQNATDTYARDANGGVMLDVKGDPIGMRNGNFRVAPGDAKYVDQNNDGVINEYDIVYLGNSLPLLTGGGGFRAKYKNIALTTLFHGRFGQKVINQARMDTESMYGRGNQSTATLKRWRTEGDDTEIPRALFGYGMNYLGSDRFIENNSYLRLKSLSITYNLPSHLVKRLSMNNVNVFITGYDLLTWTKYEGQDPEVSQPSATNALVKDESSTPVSKRFAVGININF